MENKYMKYGLITGVILVWGTVVYRVVAGTSGPDVSFPAHPSPSKPIATPVQQGFVLFADYPDPFIPEPDSLDVTDVRRGPAGSSIAAPPIPPVTVSTPPPPPTLQSFLQYRGMIDNPERKLKVAIISFHGKELLVREKEKHDEILIKGIAQDKLRVVYKGRVVEIEKED